MRIRPTFLAAALLVCAGGTASADPITITGGSAGLYFDGEPSGFTLLGTGTSIESDSRNSFGNPAFHSGTPVTFSGSLNPQNVAMFHGFTEVIDGTTYSQVLLKGVATFTTQPLVAPTAPDGMFADFEIPFTLTGHFDGYAFVDNAGIPPGATPLFGVDVTGSGLFGFEARTIADNLWFDNGGGAALIFADPQASSTTPEPATLLLLASGVGALFSRRSGARRVR